MQLCLKWLCLMVQNLSWTWDSYQCCLGVNTMWGCKYTPVPVDFQCTMPFSIILPTQVLMSWLLVAVSCESLWWSTYSAVCDNTGSTPACSVLLLVFGLLLSWQYSLAPNRILTHVFCFQHRCFPQTRLATGEIIGIFSMSVQLCVPLLLSYYLHPLCLANSKVQLGFPPPAPDLYPSAGQLLGNP